MFVICDIPPMPPVSLGFIGIDVFIPGIAGIGWVGETFRMPGIGAESFIAGIGFMAAESFIGIFRGLLDGLAAGGVAGIPFMPAMGLAAAFVVGFAAGFFRIVGEVLAEVFAEGFAEVFADFFAGAFMPGIFMPGIFAWRIESARVMESRFCLLVCCASRDPTLTVAAAAITAAQRNARDKRG
jgi:hypothetical protein